MSRQPVAASAGGDRPVRPHRLAVADDGLDEGRGGDQRQVADPGDRAVVGDGVELDHAGRARPGQLRDAIDIGRGRRRRRDDDPRPVDEQVRLRRVVAGGFAPCHRVPADEPQARGFGPADDQRLRARDIGHHGVGRRGIGADAGQPIDECQAVGRRRREDDQVGSVDGSLRRRRRRGRRRRRRAAWRGPSPDGDHATIVQPVAAGFARTARAIEPAMSPNPRNATCMGASIAAPPAGRRAAGSLSPASPFPQVAVAVAAASRHCPVGAWSAGPRPVVPGLPSPPSRDASPRRPPPADPDRRPGSRGGSPVADPSHVARRAGGHRSAGSVVPRRRATRAGRSCRSAVRTTSTRGGASRGVRIRPSAGRPGRPRRFSSGYS